MLRVVLVILLQALVLTSAFELTFDNNVEDPKPQSRIINGILARPRQFKYQVGLYIKKNQTFGLCGGSLIAPNWILTAAHCVEGAYSVYAFLGSTQFLSGILVPVNKWFLPDEWNYETRASDICLLRTPYIKMGPNIATIALPPLDRSDSYINYNVIASGWGTTSDRDRTPSDQLQYARLKIVPNSVCLKSYGSNIFRDTNICAVGARGPATCKGDSGGPLLTESGVLVGITSYSADGGCTLGYPEAFTRITSYRSWINSITGL